MKGMAGENSSLVSHVFRLLRRREVEWVFLENVPFMLQLGKGSAIRSVVAELEKLNYSWAFRVVDTRAFGIPQRRRRVFLLASLSNDPSRVLFADDFSPREQNHYKGRACGFYWTEGTRGLGWAVDAIPTLKGGSGLGIPSAPAIWFPDNRIGTPAIMDAERLQGFEPGWTAPAEEIARPSLRWKLVGNAITVDCAEWVGKCIRRKPGPRPEVVGQLPSSSSWPNAGFGAPDSDWCEVDASEWPEQRSVPSLEQFLITPVKPLSLKATSGFYNRLTASGLRRPKAFDQALEAHISSVQSSAPGVEYVKSKVAV
jgi:DNA (cytosine-5)-methyltransferase 1